MFKTLSTVLFVLSCNLALATPAQSNSAQDKAECRRAFDNAGRYVAEANGFLWKLYDGGVIGYDEFTHGQNDIMEETRVAISGIRERSYVGESYECYRFMQQAMNKVDTVLLVFMRQNGLNSGR